jgi:hypothetical protein
MRNILLIRYAARKKKLFSGDQPPDFSGSIFHLLYPEKQPH